MTELTNEQKHALTNIAREGLQDGKSKMEILTNLVRFDATIDLTQAASIYKSVGKAEGFILTDEQKKELVAQAMQQFASTDTGTIDRPKAVEFLTSKGFTKDAAVTKLKEACQSANITFPMAVRVHRDMEAVNAAYRQWFADGLNRETIQKGLQEHFGYTDKNVSNAYITIGRSLGLIKTPEKKGDEEYITWLLIPENHAGEKKDILERMGKDFGISPATADARYRTYLFAVKFYNEVARRAADNQQAAA